MAGAGSEGRRTGRVIALDSGGRIADNHGNPNFGRRRQVVGGDAKATVRFGANVNNTWMTEFKLTNLEGANVRNTDYPDLTWTFVRVPTSGNFRHDPDNPDSVNSTGPGLLTSTFHGTGAAKIGGTFEVPANSFGQNGLVGGFVADKD